MRVRDVLFAVAVLIAVPALASGEARRPAAVSAPATVSSCAMPGCDATAFVVAAIDTARSEIRGQAYGFTSTPIAEALVRAKARGVDVALLVDKTSPCARDAMIDSVAAAGIPIAVDHAPRIAHNKVLVIDRDRVIEGSFNFTVGAMRNAENTNLVGSREIAAYYRSYWDQRRAVSADYAGHDAWCRRGRERGSSR